MNVAIILNFKNAAGTISSTEIALNSGIDFVVIVDNASEDGSAERLENYFRSSKNVFIILEKVNSGYAAGNNVGLRYVERMFGVDNLIYIMNPDSILNSEFVIKTETFLANHPKIGMVTGLMANGNHTVWKHLQVWRTLFFDSIFLSKLLGYIGFQEKRYYSTSEIGKTSALSVDVVTGSLFVIKQRVFKEVGYFDEHTFMYFEEEILYVKLKKLGYQNYLLPNVAFEHIGRQSTDNNKVKYKKIFDESKIYFLKNYCKSNIIEIFYVRLINALDLQLLKLIKLMKRGE